MDAIEPAAADPAGPKATPRRNFFRRFVALAGPFWSTGDKWSVRLLTAALVMLTIGQIIAQVLLNLWSADLFNALEARDMNAFLTMVGLFALILIGGTTIMVTHLRVKRRIQLMWRTWLTHRLLDGWMSDGHHYQINHLPGEHDNPDGRIAEDIRIATEVAIDLAHSVFYCALLLVSFTNILWRLSGSPELEIGGVVLTIPGYLVWVALLYAAAGTTVAWLLGKPLVRAANRRQTFEANFRFGLAHVRENSGPIALLHGESDERRRLNSLFRGVEKAWDKQTNALTNIFTFTQAYSTLSVAFPILVVSPRFIAGSITLGALMQTAQAFQQMAAALSWPIDNLTRVAEWRASVERVLGLHEAVERLRGGSAEDHIVVEPGEEPVLSLRGLVIANPDGRVVLSAHDIDFRRRDHVLITGDPGATVKLFKTVAGLWPWGHGRVLLPADDAIHFAPQRPYLPRGPLRAALCYPQIADDYRDEQMAQALKRVGLSHLGQRLDESDNWEQALSPAEQQRLGFARMILHRPRWIFLQDATDALEGPCERDLMRLLLTDFADATVITIGNHAHLDEYHRSRYAVIRRGAALVLVPDKRQHQEASGVLRRQKVIG